MSAGESLRTRTFWRPKWSHRSLTRGALKKKIINRELIFAHPSVYSWDESWISPEVNAILSFHLFLSVSLLCICQLVQNRIPRWTITNGKRTPSNWQPTRRQWTWSDNATTPSRQSIDSKEELAKYITSYVIIKVFVSHKEVNYGGNFFFLVSLWWRRWIPECAEPYRSYTQKEYWNTVDRLSVRIGSCSYATMIMARPDNQRYAQPPV